MKKIIAIILVLVFLTVFPVAVLAQGFSHIDGVAPEGINWGQLGGQALTQLLPILIAFIGSLFALWKLWLEKHIKNETFKKAMLYATNLIAAEVGKAESWAVKQAKLVNNNGKLTPEQGAQIKKDVLVAIENQLPQDIIVALNLEIPHVADWIDAQLQKAVQTWSGKITGGEGNA